ncbi:MAG: hypothetical protein RLZZ540_272 [Bacteroidota bacterium]|jgi:hypothetical protein
MLGIILILLVGYGIYYFFFRNNSIISKDSVFYSEIKTVKIDSQPVYNNSLRVFLSGVHVASRKNYILKNGWDTMPVELSSDPGNKHDKYAISVKHEGKLIGYIPSDKTYLVHPILEKPHEARFDSMEEEDSYTNPGSIHLTVYLMIEYND